IHPRVILPRSCRQFKIGPLPGQYHREAILENLSIFLPACQLEFIVLVENLKLCVRPIDRFERIEGLELDKLNEGKGLASGRDDFVLQTVPHLNAFFIVKTTARKQPTANAIDNCIDQYIVPVSI